MLTASDNNNQTQTQHPQEHLQADPPAVVSESSAQADQAGRNAKLRAAFSLSLEATLSKFSNKNLASSFPQLESSIPDEMEAVRIETVEFIRQSVQEEFEMIMEHRGIEIKLNELDVLIEDAAVKAREALKDGKRVQHTWMDPEAAVLSKLIHLKRQELESLKKSVAEVSDENMKLTEELEVKHAESKRLQSEISFSVENLKSINAQHQQHMRA